MIFLMFTKICKLICADVHLLFSNNHCPKLFMQKFSRDLATVYIHTILRYVNFADGTNNIFHVFSFMSSLHTEMISGIITVMSNII